MLEEAYMFKLFPAERIPAWVPRDSHVNARLIRIPTRAEVLGLRVPWHVADVPANLPIEWRTSADAELTITHLRVGMTLRVSGNSSHSYCLANCSNGRFAALRIPWSCLAPIPI